MGVDTVILAANWFGYDQRHRFDLGDVQATVQAIRDEGVEVVFVGQSPIFDFVSPEEALFDQIKRGGVVGVSHSAVTVAFQDWLKGQVQPDAYFDPAAHLCDAETCQFHADGQYLVMDHGHLTLEGARRLAPLLVAQALTARRGARSRS